MLADFVIHLAGDVEPLGIDFIGSDNPRPHRTEGVERLPDKPLLMASLKVARGYIVDDGIAPDAAQRGFTADSAAATSYDDAKLGFVVETLRQLGMTGDLGAGADHAARGFCENDRHLGYFRGARIKAALVELLGVFLVVLADAEDIAPRRQDRSEQPNVGKFLRGTARDEIDGEVVIALGQARHVATEGEWSVAKRP